jgi:hypothetical protein
VQPGERFWRRIADYLGDPLSDLEAAIAAFRAGAPDVG